MLIIVFLMFDFCLLAGGMSFHLIRSAVAPNDYGLSSRGEEAEAIFFFRRLKMSTGNFIFFGLDLPINADGRPTQQEPSIFLNVR